MALPVIMPRQGQSVETCIITQWIKKKGDIVKTGDILFSYETDKASFDAEAQQDGVILEIFFNDGDEVPVLTNVAVIGETGEDTDSFRPGNSIAAAVTATTTSSTPAPVTSPAIDTATSPLRISPRARAMAVKLGINTSAINGSGPNGRIIARDIETTALSTFPSGLDYDDKKTSNIRKLIGKAMHDSISMSAQLTHHLSADVRKLTALRTRVKANIDKGSSLNITLNDMICYAVVRALKKHTAINSHFLDENIRTFKKIHLGLAVDTPRGLMVPAIQNADDLSLEDLSVRLREVADQCRKGNINPELLSGTAASFTVSNLGNYGVEIFTPIINLPQVAILGVNTIIHRPADLGNGVFGFVPMIGLSLTYDHRAVDGGPATLFLREIKEEIEGFEYKI